MVTEELTDKPETREPETQAESADPKKRERSTIEFPYTDLNDAVAIAMGVHTVGGSGCQWEQLAAHLSLKPDGGGFRQRMLGAKVFVLLKYAQKKITLTSLGSAICDPTQEGKARVSAFLAVPLYTAVYEKFKSSSLPPASGLESEMATMGVAKKQTSKARQAFHRSALQAGFFWSGQDRLVMPAIKGDGKPKEHEEGGDDSANSENANGAGGGDGGSRHPFIQGLIKTLPATEGPWPIGKRVQWLQAAVSVFNLIYTEDDSGGSIEVRFQKESA